MKRIISGWHILVATLREIFDEAAYARFLNSGGDGVVERGIFSVSARIRRG